MVMVQERLMVDCAMPAAVFICGPAQTLSIAFVICSRHRPNSASAPSHRHSMLQRETYWHFRSSATRACCLPELSWFAHQHPSLIEGAVALGRRTGSNRAYMGGRPFCITVLTYMYSYRPAFLKSYLLLTLDARHQCRPVHMTLLLKGCSAGEGCCVCVKAFRIQYQCCPIMFSAADFLLMQYYLHQVVNDVLPRKEHIAYSTLLMFMFFVQLECHYLPLSLLLLFTANLPPFALSKLMLTVPDGLDLSEKHLEMHLCKTLRCHLQCVSVCKPNPLSQTLQELQEFLQSSMQVTMLSCA